jgi:hypothetical protein
LTTRRATPDQKQSREGTPRDTEWQNEEDDADSSREWSNREEDAKGEMESINLPQMLVV